MEPLNRLSAMLAVTWYEKTLWIAIFLVFGAWAVLVGLAVIVPVAIVLVVIS